MVDISTRWGFWGRFCGSWRRRSGGRKASKHESFVTYSGECWEEVITGGISADLWMCNQRSWNQSYFWQHCWLLSQPQHSYSLFGSNKRWLLRWRWSSDFSSLVCYSRPSLQRMADHLWAKWFPFTIIFRVTSEVNYDGNLSIFSVTEFFMQKGKSVDLVLARTSDRL